MGRIIKLGKLGQLLIQRRRLNVDNITLIALGIIILWLIAVTFYLVISRQQNSLSDEVKEIEELLKSREEKSEEV